MHPIGGLEQVCSISIANALEIQHSYIKPLIYSFFIFCSCHKMSNLVKIWIQTRHEPHWILKSGVVHSYIISIDFVIPALHSSPMPCINLPQIYGLHFCCRIEILINETVQEVSCIYWAICFSNGLLEKPTWGRFVSFDFSANDVWICVQKSRWLW